MLMLTLSNPTTKYPSMQSLAGRLIRMHIGIYTNVLLLLSSEYFMQARTVQNPIGGYCS